MLTLRKILTERYSYKHFITFSACSQNVCDNQRAIQCDECNCWSHAACNGISKLEYQKLVEEDNSVEGHCLPCLIMMHAAIFPFGYESNTELYELLSIELPSHLDSLPAFEFDQS